MQITMLKNKSINTILLTILNNIYKIAIQSNDNNEYNAVNNTKWLKQYKIQYKQYPTMLITMQQ